MQVRIVAVGTLREPHWQAAAREYLKRLQPYARVEVVEVKEEPLPELGLTAEEAAARRREGERILAILAKPPRTHLVALDVQGQELSSEGLADYLAKSALEGQPSVAFVIGGASGLAPEVLTAANLRLSLSRLTLPHQLARVVLLEQLYRAFKIMRREPYHR
ncbi:MAG: 23S rRNA (pseudouridine(1915)-N(3))-methyltransferase RlmH [Betaproteobacteria bacterium]